MDEIAQRFTLIEDPRHSGYIKYKLAYEDTSLYAEKADEEDLEICQTVEKNAGRIEKRICRKLKDISWLVPHHDWPGLRSVFLIERIVDKQREGPP